MGSREVLRADSSICHRPQTSHSYLRATLTLVHFWHLHGFPVWLPPSLSRSLCATHTIFDFPFTAPVALTQSTFPCSHYVSRATVSQVFVVVVVFNLSSCLCDSSHFPAALQPFSGFTSNGICSTTLYASDLGLSSTSCWCWC